MDRKDYIGSTGAPGVIGTHAQKGPHDVWLECMGRPMKPSAYMEISLIDEISHTEMIKRKLAGLDIDPVVIKEVATYFVQRDGVNLGASPDRIAVKSNRHRLPLFLIEMKNAFMQDRDSWGEEFSADVTPGYRDQCIWHMGCAAVNGHPVERTLLSVRFSAFNWPEFFWIPRDDQRFLYMVSECVNFWKTYVDTKTPPPADPSPACRRAQLIAQEWEDKQREVTEEEYAKLQQIKKMSATKDSLGKSIDQLKNELVEALNGHMRLNRFDRKVMGVSKESKKGTRSVTMNLANVEEMTNE